LLNNDLIRKVSKLKYELDLGFIAFYCSFEKMLMLPPENWRSLTDLQRDLICGLERTQIENHKSFVLAVNKIQKCYVKCFKGT
jgi:hypothetical protein